jgi:hypothetical protein
MLDHRLSGVPWSSSATATMVLEAAFPASNAPANFTVPLPFSPSQPPLVPIPLSYFLSLEIRFYSPGLDILLACCSVDFFVFMRNGQSFIHNFSRISLEKREKFCRNGLQGREGEEQETQMYEDKGMKERGERRVLLFH